MKYAIFPLNLFLLPGEQTCLHIFEDRYKQLLRDVEETNMPFGVYFQNKNNTSSFGSMVKLIDVNRRYNGGELDITVEATYLFRLDNFYSNFDDKAYSGGNISRLEEKEDVELESLIFDALVSLVKLRHPGKLVEIPRNIWDVAFWLNLTSMDKFELVRLNSIKKQQEFIKSQISLHMAILDQDKNAEFNMYLN